MIDKKKLLEEFLYDDGYDRNIVSFAKKIGIVIFKNSDETCPEAYFFKHPEYGNCISINYKHFNNSKDYVFLVSYLMSKYILTKKKLEFYQFSLDDIDFDIYNLAKRIYEREFLYKSKSFKDTAGYQRRK